MNRFQHKKTGGSSQASAATKAETGQVDTGRAEADKTETDGAKTTTDKTACAVKPRRTAVSVFLLLGAAVGFWISSRMTWVTAHVMDDKAGVDVRSLRGADWFPVLGVISLVVLASGGLLFLVARLGSRILGVVVGLIGATVFVAIVPLVVNASVSRAQSILTTDPDRSEWGKLSRGVGEIEPISAWAHITSLDMHWAGVLTALISSFFLVLSGLILITRPGAARRTGGERFIRHSAHDESNSTDDGAGTDSERSLWDRIDAGEDPTADSKAELL